MFYSIDDYYSIQEYNITKEAIINNGLVPQEYISTKAPFKWYFKLPSEPIMINYDKCSVQDEKFLVRKTEALNPQDDYLLIRRMDGVGAKAILKYTENTPMKEARKSDFAVLFHAKSKSATQEITKELPVKIWYLGKYYNSKYRVHLCTNPMILNYIEPNDVLLVKHSSKDFKEKGSFESEFNFRVLRKKDYLQKFTETPYFSEGKYFRPKVIGTRDISKRLAL